MSVSVAPLGSARLLAVLALVVALFGVFAAPASATEAASEGAVTDEGPAPDIDEIGEHNEIADQYRPEPAEPPPFMRWFYWPLAIAGVLAAGMLLLRYLVFQPRFAEERRSKRRR